MVPYTVRLFDPNDEVGRSNNPHSIRVRQGERTVAYMPAWLPKELLWEGEAAP